VYEGSVGRRARVSFGQAGWLAGTFASSSCKLLAIHLRAQMLPLQPSFAAHWVTLDHPSYLPSHLPACLPVCLQWEAGANTTATGINPAEPVTRMSAEGLGVSDWVALCLHQHSGAQSVGMGSWMGMVQLCRLAYFPCVIFPHHIYLAGSTMSTLPAVLPCPASPCLPLPFFPTVLCPRHALQAGPRGRAGPSPGCTLLPRPAPQRHAAHSGAGHPHGEAASSQLPLVGTCV